MPPWCKIQAYLLCRSKTCPKQVSKRLTSIKWTTHWAQRWFDLDLWTCDLKINRDHLLIDGNPCTKFGIDQVEESKDIMRTTLDLQTDLQLQNNMPPFSRGGGIKIGIFLLWWSIDPGSQGSFCINGNVFLLSDNTILNIDLWPWENNSHLPLIMLINCTKLQDPWGNSSAYKARRERRTTLHHNTSRQKKFKHMLSTSVHFTEWHLHTTLNQNSK